MDGEPYYSRLCDELTAAKEEMYHNPSLPLTLFSFPLVVLSSLMYLKSHLWLGNLTSGSEEACVAAQRQEFIRHANCCWTTWGVGACDAARAYPIIITHSPQLLYFTLADDLILNKMLT